MHTITEQISGFHWETERVPSRILQISLSSNAHPLGYYNRGNVYLEDGNNDAAIADFSAAIEIMNGLTNQYDQRAHAMSYNNRGNAYAAQGKFKEALNDYDRSLKILPNTYEALTSRGSARQSVSDYRGAVEDYTAALKIFPDNDLILMNRAGANESYDLQAALSDYTTILKKDPKNAAAYLRRVLTYYELKNKDAARADLKQAFALDASLRSEYGEFLDLLN